MNPLGEETLAVRVDEASMQDWLAAVTTFKFAPPSTYSTTRYEPHPEPVRPSPPRRVASPVRREKESAQATLAGARTAFWVVLAAAVGLMALL
jgi:hypothetical protein